MKFYTIGVFNSTEEEFFGKLIQNKIDTFCDIRQRRGVRGSAYAFVNSARLQKRLNELNISYEYVAELAPTTTIRNVQHEIDHAKGERNTQRSELASAFVRAYTNEILKQFPLDDFLKRLDHLKAKRIVLFCVEELAEACHRSVVAAEIQKKYQIEVTHL